MRMFCYELKKLVSNRYVIVFFVIMTLLSVALTIVDIKKYADNVVYVDDRLIEEAYILYNEDPDTFYDDLNAFSASNQEYSKLKSEAFLRGEENLKIDEYEAILIKSYAYSTAMAENFYISEFEQNIGKVIKAAEKNISDYDANKIPSSNYQYKYQQEVIRIYSKVAKVDITPEYIKGWDKYFQSSIPVLLIIVFLLICVPSIVLAEDSTGLEQIIHTTKHGRLKLYITKFALIIFTTLFTGVVFLGLPLLTVKTLIGLSSAQNSIHAIELFVQNPLILSIKEFLAITTGVKLLTFVVLSTGIALITVLFRRYAYTFISALILLGSLFYFGTIDYFKLNNIFRILNPFFVTSSSDFFKRYLGVVINNNPVSHITFMVIVYATIFGLLAIIGGLLFVKKGRLLHPKRKKSSKAFFDNLNDTLRGIRFVPTPKRLFTYELHKMFIANKAIFIVVLFVVLKLFVSTEVYQNKSGITDKLYMNYMLDIQGETTEQKRQYIKDERTDLNSILANKTHMDNGYQNKTISYEEYSAFLSEYSTSGAKSLALEQVENRAFYIDEKAQKGQSAHFVYDTGWNLILMPEFDFLLFLLLLFLLAGSFADEYNIGFDQNLRTYKKGRAKLFGTKVLVAVFITAIAFVTFRGIDIYNVVGSYHLSAGSSPLISLEGFDAVTTEITLKAYIFIMLTISFISHIVLSLTIIFLSELLRKNIAVLGAVATAHLLPYTLTKLGFAEAGYIATTSFLNGSDYFILSAQTGLFGDFGLFAIFVSILLVIAYVLFRLSYRRWTACDPCLYCFILFDSLGNNMTVNN